MKKNTIKAFTLVEMLIVIVIIGILIASLMPRMQTAQGRARDVARKNDLSQIQTAIITSQSDRKSWPGMDEAKDGIAIADIESELLAAGMSSIPSDPNGSNINYGLGTTFTANNNDPSKDSDKNVGQYLYIVSKRNGVNNGGFVLMAKTEVEGSSNWVVCGDSTSKSSVEDRLDEGYITNETDLKDVELCKEVKSGDTCSSNSDTCTYSQTAQLRYILLY